MPSIQRNGYKLNYIDYGQGQPVILIHGWPLSLASWEYQIPAIVDAGFRCIAYDRKGFGKSTATWSNYDYNALTDDLHAVITELNLKNVILIGFSMGGGEVIRYCTKYGVNNVAKIALISSIIPLVKQKEDNPHGVPQEKLDEIITALKEDRVSFLKGFHIDFYNVGFLNKTVTQLQLDFDFSIAAHASSQATIKAAQAWMDTDFRTECEAIQIPTLIIHGKADKTVPIKTAGEQAARLMPNNIYKVYEDGPHGLNITHKAQLNEDLVAFLKG